MSVDCTSAVLNYPLADIGFKAVLFALGNYADPDGIAWPSITTIEQKSGAGRSTVKRKLDLAEELGIITRRQRYDLSTVYTFAPDFIARYRDRDKKERQHFSQTAKEVDPEPDFFHLLDPRSAVDPLPSTPGPERETPGPERETPGPQWAPNRQKNHHIEPSDILLRGNDEKTETVGEEFVRRWNELAERFRIAKCSAMDENLKKKLITRLDGFATKDEDPRAVMNKLFATIERSPFLRGEVPPTGSYKKAFRLSVPWALAPGNFARIYNNAFDGDQDEQGRDISGPQAVSFAAQAAANARARFRSNP